MKKNQNILLSRVDAIGDVVLSLPIAGILKNMYPDCTIYFLGQHYTKDIIETSQYIDRFIDWNEIKKLKQIDQINYIKSLNLSIAIHIYPNFFISWLLKSAGVPIRIGTSRRWYHQLFCNKKVSFSRRSSNLHEAQLNTNLLVPLGLKTLLPVSKIYSFYGVVPPKISDNLFGLIDKEKFNLILHPKSRGHGKEWGVENFAGLIKLLDPDKYKIFITGTESERIFVQKTILEPNPHVVDLIGKMSLTELFGFIGIADGIVASSTGPLHVAAASGIHAIGLFPPIRPVFSMRWAPIGLNSKAFEAKKICIKCKKNAKCDCLRLFKPEIIAHYLNTISKPSIEIQNQNNNIFKPEELTIDQYKAQQDKIINDFVKNTKIKVYNPNNYFEKKTRIIISLDKINKPYCGLGRVAIDFSQALINESQQSDDLVFIFTGKNSYKYLKEQQTNRFTFLNRFIAGYYGNSDILHYLHQTPSFKIRGATKTILTIHDLNFLLSKGKVKANRYLKIVQNNVNKADAIVFISNFTKEVCYQNLNIPPNKITKVIYNGVVLPDIEPQKPSFINNEPFIFTIGQCLSKKNFHVLIPFINSMTKKIKLVIAGENLTSYGSYIRKMISNYNLDNYIIMSGPISEAEKIYLYQHCQAFVFPSLAEGFGLPIIEAIRHGKPVFCSDKTSLKEIGNNFVYFWTSFEPEKMFEVYQNGMNSFDEKQKKMAYDYSLQFTWEKNASEYLKLYKSILKSN